MIAGYGAVTQALLGTLLTWGLTAAGAGCVFFIRGKHRKLLDVSLGFAAGVMTAASYWSLLEPAIQMCKDSGSYGSEGQFAFLPVAVGFLFGAIFVFGTDKFLDYLGINSANMMMSMTKSKESKEKLEDLEMMTALNKRPNNPSSVVTVDAPAPAEFADCITNQHTAQRRRHHHSHHSLRTGENGEGDRRESVANSLAARQSQWKRIMLLVVAITVHNIPEGLAVGVSFGAAASNTKASFQSARNLALGIGIQNFPEGLAVSLPLQAAGFSVWRAFWYGQLSGMVEPVFGVLGAVAVAAAQPALPYALAFAAGAMIYVVADDIIPEANASGNGKLATWGCIIGFMVMMCLDVGLG
ncbi:zinc transporter ZIP11 [Pectinophora gossypiella]|uniref:zinc transporter ZIP11 n=1 Tax=Pectinophora gossypiella TaxID=13191 RepID=UPI00214F52AB|nr:zinc transporter ZIP11 [Pectinophora gossypiella]